MKKRLATFDGGSESEILYKTLREFESQDPDFLITRNGDSFVLPYLYEKARRHSMGLKLNRDESCENYDSNRTTGKTYFSYGRILYRPATQRLFGRLHLDEENTFVYDQCRLQGLFEVSRLCRMPMHTSARASIGKCLSSLQFYYAAKRDTLIPWKPSIAEDFKSGYELFIEDRGGLVLEPLPGVHENVCEPDFASLYPSIITKYNISAETLNCTCCPNESSNRIDGLGLHICKRREGIVAKSLEPILNKRIEYKDLKNSAKTKLERQIYNERAASLKWILVCCFGYLSYRNAKFGKIDSHIAVCGYARRVLLDAMHIAENRGFRALHGIVDSLWITKPKAEQRHYEEIMAEIQNETRFRLAMEGIYKWIVFLPSKTYPANQVANRYFGAFKDGTLKVRGIEYRRHDAPLYFKKCQEEILNETGKVRQCRGTQRMR